MNDSSGFVIFKYLIDLFNLFEICIDILYVLLACDIIKSVKAVKFQVVKIVENEHIITILNKFDRYEGINAAETSCHQDFILR